MVGRTTTEVVGRDVATADDVATDVDVATAEGADDADLVEAARRGDAHSYAVLYERHRTDVRRLARRLCRDHHEADDVVSEVFYNTLRALRRGSGPSPDVLRPYLLRSVRNTVIKLRTRSDTGRAEPTAPQLLDRPDERDPFFTAGAVSSAFGAVSDRHRRVLWSVEVEGIPTGAVAESENIAAPAAASLAYRARCALRRAYIAESVSPTSEPACVPIRALIPQYVSGGLRSAKAEMVRTHRDECIDCAAALENARVLQSSLSSRSPVGPLLLAVGAMVSRVGRSIVSLVSTAPIATVAGTTALVVGLGAIVPEQSTPEEAVVPGVVPTVVAAIDDVAAATGEAEADQAGTSTVGAQSVASSPDPLDVWTAQLRRVPPGRAVVDPPVGDDESEQGGDAGTSVSPPADVVETNEQGDVDDLGDVAGTTTGLVVDVVDRGLGVIDQMTEVVNVSVDDTLDAVAGTVREATEGVVVVDSVAQPALDLVEEATDRATERVLDDDGDELLDAVSSLGHGAEMVVDELVDGG